MAERKGVELTHLVLAWYLTVESIDAIIPGAKNPEQVKNNLKTLDVQLSNDEVEEVRRIFD